MVMRTICVVTGSRAEYGLLSPILKELQNDHDVELQLVVTGMHLAPEFGLTVEAIKNDGYPITEKVEMQLSSDTPSAITKSMGLGLIGFSDVFRRLRPDIVVILGDRYEMLVVAQAAMLATIPIAHIHGGESTQGAIDEAIRHSITKMSHIHFTATEVYRRRVMQLGENPERVYNLGAIGLDNIAKLNLLNKPELEESLRFRLGQVNFLVTYHPTTLGTQSSRELIGQLLIALDEFPEARILFTMPNSDADGRIIAKLIDEYVAARAERTASFVSLGQLRYLSALRIVDAVIGNSSSGIIEAPALGTPTVNIGTRQSGRVKGPTVIDCDTNCASIVTAIRKALSPDFRAETLGEASLYGTGNVAPRMKEILKNVQLEGILHKAFYDLEVRE